MNDPRILVARHKQATTTHLAWFILLNFFINAHGSPLQACSEGDAPCFCKSIKGTWQATPSTILPTCRKTVQFEGASRIVDVYFPRNIRSSGTSTRYTVWLHLHGVHKADWVLSDYPQWQQLQKSWALPLAGNVEAARLGVLAGPRLDTAGPAGSGKSSSNREAGLVNEDNVILVVPNAPGTAASGQIWNSIFWPCMAALGKCADKNTDDVGYIKYLINNMQSILSGLPLQPRVQVSGYSNGGMLLQALLCRQPSIASKLSGVAIVASTLGSEFAAKSCQQKLPSQLPLLWVHGINDTTLPYTRGTSEGLAVLGAEAAVKLWTSNLGCQVVPVQPGGGASSSSSRSGLLYESADASCRNYCQQGGGRPPVVLCSLPGAGHLVWTELPAGYTSHLVRWALQQGFKGKPGM